MSRWLLSLLLLSTPAAAQCWIVTGATVHTPGGAREGVSLVVADGVIAAIEAGLSATGDTVRWADRACAHVDAAGGHVTAGLIDAHTQLGLTEILLERHTRDHSPHGDDLVNAAHVVAEAYDPRSSLIPVARLGGLTSAVVHPDGGLVPGQAGAVDLFGQTQAEAVFAPSVAMTVDLGWAPSKADTLAKLRELLQDARSYAADEKAFDRGERRPLGATWIDLQALWRVTKRQIPVVIGADRAADLEMLARFATEQNLRLVVRGAAEGWMVAEQLKAAGVAVIVDPVVVGPGSFDQMAGRADNAALLSRAGVDVIISTSHSHHARELRFMAGNAVRAGMPFDAALAAVTSTPAKVFGLGERGKLAVGAKADVAVWSGDPLETLSVLTRLFVGGQDVPLTSRQTALRDRYRELPGTPPLPLPLPQ